MYYHRKYIFEKLVNNSIIGKMFIVYTFYSLMGGCLYSENIMFSTQTPRMSTSECFDNAILLQLENE